MDGDKRIKEALQILIDLDVPREQQNERTALCILALLDVMPDTKWHDVKNPLVGITPMMEFARKYYNKNYAPNTRETFRRFSMHQLVEAGIALYNPDDPSRPVNSPKAVYQISAAAYYLIKHYQLPEYPQLLEQFRKEIGSLAMRYQDERQMNMVPVTITTGETISLSVGEHSELIKKIIEQFAPRFVPGSILLYVGDTGNKWGYFAESEFNALSLHADKHGKMPDVILYQSDKSRLILAESVTSHGPVDSKRRIELQKLFPVNMDIVYLSAFPDKHTFTRFSQEIAWETEVWIADNPTHMIHYNGNKFL
jgi:type II restriction enzyme